MKFWGKIEKRPRRDAPVLVMHGLVLCAGPSGCFYRDSYVDGFAHQKRKMPSVLGEIDGIMAGCFPAMHGVSLSGCTSFAGKQTKPRMANYFLPWQLSTLPSRSGGDNPQLFSAIGYSYSRILLTLLLVTIHCGEGNSQEPRPQKLAHGILLSPVLQVFALYRQIVCKTNVRAHDMEDV